MTDESTTEEGSITFSDHKPDNTVRFYLNGKEVACFDFGASPITFVGDVDASAKMFVDAVIYQFGLLNNPLKTS